MAAGTAAPWPAPSLPQEFELRSGPYKGQVVPVDGPEYETVAGIGANCGIWDAHAVLEANFYCDTYGIDTISFGTSLAFAMECYEEGVLNKEHTADLELNFGNADAMLEVLHQMGRGEGFGVILGQGIRRMKKLFAEEYGADPQFLQDIGMEAKGLEYSEYVTKESLAQQGGYGLANKGPQHDEAWLIFMDAVNNQIPTFEDKAEALHYFPMWRTWFGLTGLCKLPWNDVEPADNRTATQASTQPKCQSMFRIMSICSEVSPAATISRRATTWSACPRWSTTFSGSLTSRWALAPASTTPYPIAR